MNSTTRQPQYDIFLTHAGDDAQIAEKLYELLDPHLKVFLDSKTLIPGDDWEIVLPQAQRDSLVTVVLISPSTNNAFYQREEIAAAIALARDAPSTHRVIPVYLDDVLSSKEPSDNVPYGLRTKHSIKMQGTTTLDAVVQQLRDTLTQLQPDEQKTWLDVQRGFEKPLALKSKNTVRGESANYVTITKFKEKLPFLLSRHKQFNTESTLAILLNLAVNNDGTYHLLESWKSGDGDHLADQIPVNHYVTMQEIYGLLAKSTQGVNDNTGDLLFRHGSGEEFKEWSLSHPIESGQNSPLVGEIKEVKGKVTIGHNIYIEKEEYNY